MEVDVKAETCLQMELHSRILSVSAWSVCESVTRSGNEFDSAELEKEKQGLKLKLKGFMKAFGGFRMEMKRLLSSIEGWIERG